MRLEFIALGIDFVRHDFNPVFPRLGGRLRWGQRELRFDQPPLQLSPEDVANKTRTGKASKDDRSNNK
jgi:hypothetical protein